MSDNNPQTAAVMEAACVDDEFPQGKVWTVDEVAKMLARPIAASNGNGASAAAVATQLVSGRYEGANTGDGEFRLELRVDVDGKRSTDIVSGDLFKRSGGGLSGGGGVLKHWGSFLIPMPEFAAGLDGFTVKGDLVYAAKEKAPCVNVTIPRALSNATMPPAKVTFLRKGVAEDTFVCEYVSPFFRTVEYEVDMVEGTAIFDSHTAELPGAPPRKLKFVTPYADAGIEMRRAGVTNVVPEVGAALLAGDDSKWSDSELHASMLTQFSLLDAAAQQDLRREKQWRLWVLVATRHEHDSMRGMMFNSREGRQRQGCAVFYDPIKGDTPEEKRAALRTYVHEMGHCFNLVHPWEEERPESLSFMNYVDKYPDGKEAYWKKFAFEFDAGEVVHLRHAFRDDIIMGGNFFGTSADERGAHTFSRPLSDDSGLELKLDARRSFMLCEPLVVELKLYRKGLVCKSVHKSIHPDRGFVKLAIRKPSGSVVTYRPFATRCVEPETIVLDDANPSIYASAYIGYGKDGFYFDQTGFYQVVAVYCSPGGAEVVSEPLTVRVRNPLNVAEEEIADLYYGDDQGALFYLLGSDSESLSPGNKSLDNVIDKYLHHPLAVHALLVKGVNAGRRFKTVTAGKVLKAREPDSKDDSREILSNIVNSAIKGASFFRKVWNSVGGGPQAPDVVAGGSRLDNITLNMCVRRLARAYRRSGNKKSANATLDAARDYFRRKGLKSHVLRFIEGQLAKEKD